MTVLPSAQVVHRSAGRLRLSVPAMRRQEAWFAAVRDTLAGLDGAGDVQVNPLSASVLLDGIRIDESGLFEIATGRGLFALEAGDNATLSPGPGVLDFLDEFKALPWGGLRRAASLGYLGLAAVQAFRGQVLPPALTLLWYGIGESPPGPPE